MWVPATVRAPLARVPTPERVPVTVRPPVISSTRVSVVPSARLPEISPLTAESAVTLTVPERAEAPTRAPPDRVMSLLAATPLRSSVPPLTVTAPVPRVPEPESRRVPLLTVVAA